MQPKPNETEIDLALFESFIAFLTPEKGRMKLPKALKT